MRERLHELNGQLEIESAGLGTTMRATVPFYATTLPLLMEVAVKLRRPHRPKLRFMFTVFSNRSKPPIRHGFPTSGADVHDPPRSPLSFPCRHVLPIRFTDLRYFLPQLCDAVFTGFCMGIIRLRIRARDCFGCPENRANSLSHLVVRLRKNSDPPPGISGVPTTNASARIVVPPLLAAPA